MSSGWDKRHSPVGHASINVTPVEFLQPFLVTRQLFITHSTLQASSKNNSFPLLNDFWKPLSTVHFASVTTKSRIFCCRKNCSRFPEYYPRVLVLESGPGQSSVRDFSDVVPRSTIYILISFPLFFFHFFFRMLKELGSRGYKNMIVIEFG